MNSSERTLTFFVTNHCNSVNGFSFLQAFFELGVLPGYDMTTEAALAKLSYVLALENLSLNQRKEVRLATFYVCHVAMIT